MSILIRSSAAVLRAFRYATRMGLPDVRPVFISIPKTGSTSVARMLRTAYWGHPVLYLPIGGDDRERILRMPRSIFQSLWRVSRLSSTLRLRKSGCRILSSSLSCGTRKSVLYQIYTMGQPKGAYESFLFEDWSPDDGNFMTRMLAGGTDADVAIEVLSSWISSGVTERIASDMPRLLARLGQTERADGHEERESEATSTGRAVAPDPFAAGRVDRGRSQDL